MVFFCVFCVFFASSESGILDAYYDKHSCPRLFKKGQGRF